MARDTKVGMLLGLGIILLVGIFVSDYLRPAANPPEEAAAGFAGAAMDRGRGAPAPTPAVVGPATPGTAEVGFIPLGPPREEVGSAGDGVAAGPQAFPAPLPAFRPAPSAADEAPLLIRRSTPAAPVDEPELGRPGGQRSLMIRTGDTLPQLSFELYGDTGYAEALAAANPHAIDTTGRPVPGMELIVPDFAGLVAGTRASTPPAPAPATAILLPPPAAELRAAPPAAAPVVAAVAGVEDAKEVTVEAGDSLSRLAARHLGDANRYLELYEANRDRLDSPDDVQLGMKLRLPADATTQKTAPSTAPAASPAGTRAVAGVSTYTVRPGDSLSRIAGRVLGDPARWEELFEANRDLLGSPDRVVVGQELRIPG